MKLIKQRLDYGTPWSMPDIYLFTGNAIRNKHGALVMGAGAAKAVRDAYPGIDKAVITSEAGLAFTAIPESCGGQSDQWLGWFQTKRHWRSKAEVKLIKETSFRLARLAKHRPEVTFHLNAPGVGAGGLSWSQVEPIISQCPDNVHVYLIDPHG